MEGVTSNLIVGPCTEALAGEGHIFTAGATDAHVHFICPQLIPEVCIKKLLFIISEFLLILTYYILQAISSGITTLVGGGTGPNTGTNPTTCTQGRTHIEMMLT